MGFFGYFMKKDKWWGLVILAPMLLFLGIHYSGFLDQTIYNFPHHLLSMLFCVITMLIYPICIFKDKKIKIVGAAISALIIAIMTVITLFNNTTYNTTVLVNGGEAGAVFDDTYKAYLEDERFGRVYIIKDENLEDYMLNAEFKKAGKTNIIIENASGDKQIFEIDIKSNSYDIKKQLGK
jgi:hypothetical protein